MSRAKLITRSLYMDNHTFRQAFLTSLTKLNDNATRKIGLEEIRHILIVHVQDTDRFNSVLTFITDNSEYQKIGAKRESAKIIRILSEVFEENLIRFIPKIMQVVHRKLQDDDNQLHENLSDALGDLVRISLGPVDVHLACTAIRTMLNRLFHLCVKDTKHIQTGAALCVSKIVQATPFACLEVLLNEIASKVAELLRLNNCRSHLQLFECVLSYMMGFKDDRDRLEETADNMLPITLYNMANSDWNVRRVAIQVLHVMSILVPKIVKLELDVVLEALNLCRFDKIKNVRDVAVTTLSYVQKLTPPQSPVSDRKRLEISFERAPSPFNKSSSKDHSLRTPTGRGTSMDKKKWPSNILVDSDDKSDFSLSQRAKSAPKIRPKSVEGRRTRQINKNFFNNTLKNGEVEIYAKSPSPEPSEKTQATLGNRIFSSNSIKISDASRQNTSSSNRRNVEPNLKPRVSIKTQNEISGNMLLSPELEEVESVIFQSPTAPSSQFQRYFRDNERDRKMLLKKDQPVIPTNSIRGSQPSLELEYINEKNVNLNLNLTQTHSKTKLPPEEGIQENLGVLVKQLNSLNKQQSKAIDTISGFHSTTNTEIDRIKGRLEHLELMQRDNHARMPRQAIPYSFTPSYTPPYTPTYISGIPSPSPFQFPYQTQYANYQSNFYPNQGGMRTDIGMNMQTAASGMSQSMHQGLTQSMPQSLSQSMPQGLSQSLSQSMPQGLSQSMHHGLNQGMSQGPNQGLNPSLNQTLNQGLSQGGMRTDLGLNIQTGGSGVSQGLNQGANQGLNQGNMSPKKAAYASAHSYQNSYLSSNSIVVPGLQFDNENEDQREDESNTSISKYRKQATMGSRKSSPTRSLSRTLSYKRLGERKDSREESSILKSREAKGESDNKALEAKLREMLDEDHLNVAYEICLKKGDENTLLNLMIYSGNVTKQLEIPIVENLLNKLKNKIEDKTKSGLVIDWIERVVEDGISVSKETMLAVHEKLIERLEDKSTLSGSEYRRMKNLTDNIEFMLDMETKEK